MGLVMFIVWGTTMTKLDPRSAQLIFFVALPIFSGLITLFGGSLAPIGTMIGIYLVPIFVLWTGRRFRPGTLPLGKPVNQGLLAQWWNSRRRYGFYVSFSVLIMISLALLRSAVTDTWGGGDFLLALVCFVPLFVILRKPPLIVDGFETRKGRGRS
jgi:hypothetical protein